MVWLSDVFTFLEEGAILCFKTNDRYGIGPQGHTVSIPWTTESGNYRCTVTGKKAKGV